ncbi:MAG: 23S rRNA (uracil(1939)-C(5))-methyltransferase RlmD [Clostridiales bacterium]|nr:23S rRNA (uracil(1939)-C(5))-methyltransferase RlmD [Clostridiales bacterium]
MKTGKSMEIKRTDSKAGRKVNGKKYDKGSKREEYKYKADKERSKKGNSRCEAFGECGGCQMIDMPYEEQLKLKQKECASLLKPFVRLEGIIGMEEPEHYRNKVNAAFTHDRKGKPLSGVYKEGTHYIIPVEECLLENKKADEIIGSIRELLPSFKIKTYDEDTGYGLLRHVMVRVGHTSGQIMVVLVLSSPIMPSKNNFVKALLKLHPDITTIIVNVNDRKTSMVLGDKEQVIYGKGYIEDTLNGKSFKISPKSFYQVNSVQTERLYGKAIEYAGLTGRETVLDAYCGIGTIGIMAAEKAKQVIGVELNRDAVKDGIINAKQNKISNIQFYQKDAGEFMVQLAEQGTQIDTVFMDPPRAGSDEVFLNSLSALKPKKIVYVSCNPETLARDLKYLVKKGYKAARAVAVDMFPFTGHVETVVLMSKVK